MKKYGRAEIRRIGAITYKSRLLVFRSVIILFYIYVQKYRPRDSPSPPPLSQRNFHSMSIYIF